MSKVNKTLAGYTSEAASTLPSLIEEGSLLSTESKALAFVSGLATTFKGYIENTVTYFNGLKLGNYSKQKVDIDELKEVLVGKEYQKIRGTYVAVPPGFSGKWVPFLRFLIDTILPAVEATEITLKTVNTKLATALTDPDRLKAQSGIRDLAKNLALIPQEDFDKIKTYFQNGGRVQTTLGAVAERNADIEEAFILINKLNADVGAIDFTNIQKLINRLVVLVQELRKELDGKEGDSMSGLVTSQLSDLFYKVGITVTAGAVLVDMTEQFTSAMTNARDDIVVALKS